jgi:hypothetical protein
VVEGGARFCFLLAVEVYAASAKEHPGRFHPACGLTRVTVPPGDDPFDARVLLWNFVRALAKAIPS